MSYAALLKEAYIGGYFFFVEEGTVVDGQTVSELIKPDVDPVDNWPQFGDIISFQPSTETVDDPWLKLMQSGRLVKQNRAPVISDSIQFQSRQQNELVLRLAYGLTSKIALGVAQSPNMSFDRVLRGWCRWQQRQLGEGTDRLILDWWGEIRLAEQSAYEGAQANMPSLIVTKLGEALGDSIVFPDNS